MPPKIVAVVATRNEEAYIRNCLRNLIEEGLYVAVIDNGSEDATLDIVRDPEFAEHLVALRHLPYAGEFDLDSQIAAKQALIDGLDADWVIHVDADEVMQSYREGERLCDFIARADSCGNNVINFDEFVFLPIDREYVSNQAGSQPLLHYYFFEPHAQRLMRAWKNGCGLLTGEGGHKVSGPDVKVALESGALRHYIFRTQEHARKKYAGRTFHPEDLGRGWHSNRVGFPSENFNFPPEWSLCRLARAESRELHRGFPWIMHYWQWQRLPSPPESSA